MAFKQTIDILKQTSHFEHGEISHRPPNFADCILKKRKSGMAGICKGRAAADNRKSSLHILRQVQAALL